MTTLAPSSVCKKACLPAWHHPTAELLSSVDRHSTAVSGHRPDPLLNKGGCVCKCVDWQRRGVSLLTAGNSAWVVHSLFVVRDCICAVAPSWQLQFCVPVSVSEYNSCE